MALGPIGSAIFTNQMTANVASVQNAHNNRVEIQNMMAQSVVNERDEKVLKVRPAEENQEIDEDREHTKDEAERENERSKKRDNNEEEIQTEEKQFKLDILV